MRVSCPQYLRLQARLRAHCTAGEGIRQRVDDGAGASRPPLAATRRRLWSSRKGNCFHDVESRREAPSRLACGRGRVNGRRRGTGLSPLPKFRHMAALLQ